MAEDDTPVIIAVRFLGGHFERDEDINKNDTNYAIAPDKLKIVKYWMLPRNLYWLMEKSGLYSPGIGYGNKTALYNLTGSEAVQWLDLNCPKPKRSAK